MKKMTLSILCLFCSISGAGIRGAGKIKTGVLGINIYIYCDKCRQYECIHQKTKTPLFPILCPQDDIDLYCFLFLYGITKCPCN